MGKTFSYRSFEEFGAAHHMSQDENQALRQRAQQAKFKFLSQENRLSAEPRGREIDLRRGRKAVR